MDGFKEFQGKTLDIAIEEACSYFNAGREKLEIEIIQDAKKGIFGIVGARKAKIRARRVRLHEALESILGSRDEFAASLTRREGDAASKSGDVPAPVKEQASASSGNKPSQKPAVEESVPQPKKRVPRQEQSAQAEPRREVPRLRKAPQQPAQMPAEDVAETSEGASRPEVQSGRSRPLRDERRDDRRDERRPRGQGRQRPPRRSSPEDVVEAAPRRQPVMDLGDDAEDVSGYKSFEDVDKTVAMEAAVEVVSNLIRPIVDGTPELSAVVGDMRIHVLVNGLDDCGLLIGREGLTLAAVQYIASRIVSRRVESSVRIQVDVGDYRQRQDDKLREMALSLAEKVRQTGRSFSTRPLSSYHRRIVHICLREVEGVQTRSIGDGSMKRVVIMRRKPGQGPDRSAESVHD